MGIDKRQTDRVRFERGYGASIAALDGTWQRRCLVDDVSQTGAKLMVMGSIESLDVSEFFLILSTTGPIRRRCQKAWVNGDTIGVRFVHAKPAGEAVDRRKRRLNLNEPPPRG
jgi:hypothetical protein